MLSELLELEMILQTIPLMNMLIRRLEVNVENMKDTNNTCLPLLLILSMYVLTVCYVLLKLDVSKSVTGGDFFPRSIATSFADF